MRQISVVLIGLGRMGTRFFDKFSEVGGDRIRILAVCELDESNPKVAEAKAKGIAYFGSYRDAVDTFGEDIDIILDTTNVAKVKQDIRKVLADQNNHHTVLVPMVVDYLMWYLLPGNEPIPQDHVSIGY
ncbi:MAG: homoserine dehydrogenase [Campylobacterales bacterium]